MSKLPPMPMTTDSQAIGDLLRRIGDLERVVQQLEGVVSPYDGSTQSGMFATGSIGGGDVGTGQLAGSHFGSLTIAAILASSGTQLQGSTYVGAGAQVILASGVSQPITNPGLALVSGGSLVAGTTYYVSFSWFDGASQETTVYAPAASIKAVGTSLSITVTLPIAPTGASQARVYMDTAAFGVAGGKLQQAVAVSTTAVTTLTITSFNSGGAASIAATSFSAANTAKLQPASAVDSTGAAYGWTLEGNGRARFLGPTINSQFWLYDDFYYPAGVYPGTGATTAFGTWNTASGGTAASIAAGTSLNTDPGVVQLATGTTTTGTATVRTGSSFGYGIGRLRYSIYFMFDTAPSATNTYQIILGITNTAGAGTGATHMVAGGTGVCFQFLADNSASPQLVLVTGNGSAITTSAGVALTAGNWYFAEWEIDAGLTGVDWWVGGVKQTRQVGTLPTAAAIVRGAFFAIEKTATGAGVASRTLNVDTVALFGDYVSG